MNRIPRLKPLMATFALLFALSGCINRDLDDNETFRQAQSAEMAADNALLLSKIFVLAESNTYLWFDLNNEVANFSRPELLLPIDNNGVDGLLRIPLRGLLYEYQAASQTLTFKQVPARFLNWGDATASFVFTLQQVEGSGALLPGGKQVKGSKAVFELTLKAIQLADEGMPIAVGTPFAADGKTRTLKAYTQKLTLVN